MSDIVQDTSSGIEDSPPAFPPVVAQDQPSSTPLATALATVPIAPSLTSYRGANTVATFRDRESELGALLQGAGIFDLGLRSRIEVRGEDRVRWLNGMLTNDVQGLRENEGNYSFVLNAQGRIQGDCQTFRLQHRLVLHTDRPQVAPLLSHFDRFIIMDDVELRDLSAESTALGLAGPKAAETLRALGVDVPAGSNEPSRTSSLTIGSVAIAGVTAELIADRLGRIPHFELWLQPEHVSSVWEALTAGGVPCGAAALDALRTLEGIPLYGVDLLERDLSQEANQSHALNFSKGCYLGQEIVERVRSRGSVHRRLAQFTLSSMPAQLPAELSSDGKPAGRLTSATRWQGAVYGIGMARVEALERGAALEYAEGTATLLQAPPVGDSQV
jgi:folate-binding protein YgfZ